MCSSFFSATVANTMTKDSLQEGKVYFVYTSRSQSTIEVRACSQIRSLKQEQWLDAVCCVAYRLSLSSLSYSSALGLYQLQHLDPQFIIKTMSYRYNYRPT